MELGETQNRSPEALKSLGHDFKIKNLDFHETHSKTTKIVDLSSSEGQLGAQIRFEEAVKLRENELEGAESKRREKNSREER